MNKEKNQIKPTMFIDTISTDVSSNHSLIYYDSRSKTNNKKWNIEKPLSLIEQKIEGMMKLVRKGMNIKVLLELKNKNIEGILKEKDNKMLSVEVNNDIINIGTNEIKDIILIDL